MIKLQNFCAILILLSLVACDDKTSKQPSQLQQDFAAKSTPAPTGIEQLQARLVTNPNDFATLSALADMYFESSQYIDAFQTYDRAIAVNPNCADCYNDRGLCLFYIGDATSALESFDKAVAIDPSMIHAWLSKGFVLTSEGRYEEAVVPLNKVKELDTTGQLALQADKFLAMGAEKANQ
jgi:tetratricopeptide (TPR) repeat protein